MNYDGSIRMRVHLKLFYSSFYKHNLLNQALKTDDIEGTRFV